ncbi:hypothetical protein [Candidatus Synechococcus spongiarum]
MARPLLGSLSCPGGRGAFGAFAGRVPGGGFGGRGRGPGLP